MYSRVAPQPQPVSSASPIPNLVQLEQHPQLVDLPQQAFQQPAPHTGPRPQMSNEQHPVQATNNQWQQQQQSYAQQQQLHQQQLQHQQQQQQAATIHHHEQQRQQPPQSSSYFTASSFQQVPPRAPTDDAMFKVPQAPPTSKRQQVCGERSVSSYDHLDISTPTYLCQVDVQISIYTTKIDGVVCPPNISETVAGRLMKLAHRPRIASTMIKLISKPILLPILLILVKTIQRIVADPKRKLSPPFNSADSIPSLGHPAPGSGKMLSLTLLCDYSVWVTETGAPGSGKTIQPIRI